MDYTALPRVASTSPVIASAGFTEAELARSGTACDCRVLPLAAVPCAIVNRDTRGLVKLVAEADTGRIRSAHAVADGAWELITATVYALRAAMTLRTASPRRSALTVTFRTARLSDFSPQMTRFY